MAKNNPTTNYQLLSTTPAPLLVIVGETASGKSGLAMDLAKRFNGELVCADSWTIYKDFDIGTAKPTKAEQSLVRHHMLDIVEAHDGFNAALFKELAQAVIAEVQARGKLPIMVGGTGLYIDSVLYDYGFLPTVHPDERAQRNDRELSELLREAADRNIDLSGIDSQNKRRVIRALETNGQRPTNTSLRPNTVVVGIQTNRDDLHQRITQRADNMLAMGLEQEVRVLQHKYGWDAEPMKGIGYREWRSFLESSKNVEEVREKIISASMNLAKRQRTWLKRNNSIHWVKGSSEPISLVTKWLQTGSSE